MNFRHADFDDLNAIAEGLKKAWVKAKDYKLWLEDYNDLERDDENVAIALLSDEDLNCYIVEDTYLVVFMVQESSTKRRKILSEYLVMKCYDGDASFESVVEFLDYKAIQLGCKYINVGTAFTKNDEALARVYESFGFKRQAIQLSKYAGEALWV